MSYTPKQLYRRLKQTIIGQDEYLKKLSTIVWLHDQRIRANKKRGFKGNHHKQNLMVVGPTGSGKTLGITTLAKLYGYDVGIFNAVDFTGSGWKGRDCNEMIKELYLQCEKDIKRTEQAIVFLDEIDKLILQKDPEHPSFSAENSLLKLVEGMPVTFDLGDRYNVTVSTENILFICAGAFEGIEYEVRRRLGQKKMGFKTEQEHDKATVKIKSWYSHITRQDLLAFGVGAQFMGRFADIAYLNPLDRNDLKNILLESDFSLVKDMTSILWETNNVAVMIDAAGADVVAGLAIKEGTGARGLSQIVLPKLQEAIFNIDEIDPYSRICISADETGEITITKEEGSELDRRLENAKRGGAINCRPKKNRVENFADYVLAAYPYLADANMREIRAAHALICCIVMYILLECLDSDHTVESILKLLRVLENPDEYNDESIMEELLSEKKNMDYHFYFDKFTHLDPSRKSIKLAIKAVECFMTKPKYELQPLV